MINNELTRAAVSLLRHADIDGETMEYIITDLGMREQMCQQLQLMDVQRLIANLSNPSRDCSCIAEGFSEPSTAEAPKLLTDLDIEDIAEDLAAYIARNAEGILDLDNAELSLDHCRTVQIESCAIDEAQLAEQITDQLVMLMAKRGLFQDAE